MVWVVASFALILALVWMVDQRFLKPMKAFDAYLQGRAKLEHRVGHTPLGALSVFALLLVLLAQVTTGLMSDDEIAFFGPLVRFVSGDTVALATSYHKNVGKFIVIALVVLHVAAIVFYKWVKKDNLVRPMVVGDKQMAASLKVPQARDSVASRALALMVLAVCGGAVAWLVRLGSAF